MVSYHSKEKVTKTHTPVQLSPSPRKVNCLHLYHPHSALWGLPSPPPIVWASARPKVSQQTALTFGVRKFLTAWNYPAGSFKTLAPALLDLWTTFIRETQTCSHPFLKSLGWGRHRVPWKGGKPPWAHVLFVYSFCYSILQRELFVHIDNCMSALLSRKPEPPADWSQGCPLLVAVDPGSSSEYGSCYHCFIDWQPHCPWSKSRVPLFVRKSHFVLLWNSSS